VRPKRFSVYVKKRYYLILQGSGLHTQGEV